MWMPRSQIRIFLEKISLSLRPWTIPNAELSVVLDTILVEGEDEDVDMHPVSPRPAGAPTEPTGGAPPLPALPPPAPPAEMPPPPAPLAPQPALANRKKSRLNYSKRTLIAGPELYAPTEHGVTAKRLRGKIASCPTKNNDNCFTIKWLEAHPSIPPAGLTTEFPKVDFASPIQHACLVYDTLAAQSTTSVPPQAPTDVPPQALPPPAAAAELATPQRAAPLAALVTAASVSTNASTVSTLTNSHRSQYTRDGLRSAANNVTDVESDSDEDSDLDPNENTWKDIFPGDNGKKDIFPGDNGNEYDDSEEPNPNEFLKSLKWKFDEVTLTLKKNPLIGKKHPLPEMFHDDGYTGLRSGVAESFRNPFECFEKVSGFDYLFVARLAANSNHYFRTVLKPKQADTRNPNIFHHEKWRPIQVYEMYHFLGIMLKISMRQMDGGGYKAYFQRSDRVVKATNDPNRPTKILSHSAGIAYNYMTLSRFCQIPASFHPMQKLVESYKADKCYQLCNALNTFNAASMKNFDASGNIAFDEGGIPMRSPFCPVRMYSPDKPDKFRVELFLLSASHIAILHADVYQGRNSENVNIAEDARDLPTTMKAVVNSLIKAPLVHDTQRGYRTLYADNRYMCPKLAVLLKRRYDILACGTCRTHRKGWPSEQLNLKKSDERGTSRSVYDAVNEVACTEWVDSKVVRACSTLNKLQDVPVTRQVDSVKKSFSVPKNLRCYQQNICRSG